MRIIGIDFGTSNCCICVCEDGQLPRVISIENRPLFPSYINFKNMDNILTGVSAYNHRDIVDGYVVTCNKLFLGRNYGTVTNQLTNVCFAKIVEDDKGLCAFSIPQQNGQVVISSQRVVEEILRKLFDVAKKELHNCPPDEVWITIPATYGQIQKGIMRRAVTHVMKECKSVQFITEPSAAALYYGLSEQDNQLKDGYYMIYDLGGGTFDVSIILKIGNRFVIIGTSGHPTIGGSRFDGHLVGFLQEKYKNLIVAQKRDENEAILLPNENEDQYFYFIHKDELFKLCREAKEVLSTPGCLSTELSIDKYMKSVAGHLEEVDDDDENVNEFFEDVIIERREFECLIKPDIDCTFDILRKLLDDCQLKKEDINRVLLLGGSSHIPFVQERLKLEFGEEKVGRDIDPSTCVALGAALNGREGRVETNNVQLVECSLYNIEMRIANEKNYSVLIPAGTEFPYENVRYFIISKGVYEVSAPIYENIDGEHILICNCILRRRDDDEGEEDARVAVHFRILRTGELSISYVSADGDNMQQISLVI